MKHKNYLDSRRLTWAVPLLASACYSGIEVNADPDTAGPPDGADGGGDTPDAQSWHALEAFPGVQGTPATLTLMTRKGPVDVAYLHLENGYGIFEGDIVLYTPEDGGMRSHFTPDGLTSAPRPQHGGVTTMPGERWINREIFWEYDPGSMWDFPGAENVQVAFEQAMDDIIMAGVDVDFVPFDPMVDDADTNRIRVYSNETAGCFSHVGRQIVWNPMSEIGPQALTLGPTCGTGGARHELSHAIGLYHEQDRADRDLHVTVNKANAINQYKYVFGPPELTDDIGAYNINSIMHYSSCAFSRCTPQVGDDAEHCWGVDENDEMFECGYGNADDNPACSHCECEENNRCKFPTILGPGGTMLKQHWTLQPSDIAALEYALGCPDGVDGYYCGDVIGLDSGILYTCINGEYDIKEICDDACEASLAPGINDNCAGGTPDPNAECTSGPCCENGDFSPPSTVCAEDADAEYGCPWGTAAGADVGVRTRDRTCSGSSGACNGVYGDWKSWEINDPPCASDEYCDPGVPSCNAMPPMTDCDAGPCCDPDGFYRPAGYVCLDDAEKQYGCPWGTTLGEDVGVRHRDQTCSGSNELCDGSFASWEPWQTQDACASDETCVPEDPNCAPCSETCESQPSYPVWTDSTGYYTVKARMSVSGCTGTIEMQKGAGGNFTIAGTMKVLDEDFNLVASQSYGTQQSSVQTEVNLDAFLGNQDQRYVWVMAESDGGSCPNNDGCYSAARSNDVPACGGSICVTKSCE